MKKFARLLRNQYVQIATGILGVLMVGGWLMSLAEPVSDQGIAEGTNPYWWALVTMLTVGYGDFFPKSDLGRLVGMVVMFGGITTIALFTAVISSAFVAKRLREEKGLGTVNASGHILICGWNRSIHRILDSLQILSQGKKLDVVFINEQTEEEILAVRSRHRESNFRFVRGDFTREVTLEQANVREAATAILLPDDTGASRHPDEKTIFATLTIKTLAPKVRVVAYLADRENLTHIKRANADEVIVADDVGPYLAAAHVFDPGVPQIVERLFSDKAPERFRRVDIPAQFVERTYGDLFRHFRESHRWLLVGLVSEEEQMGMGTVLTSDSSALDAFIERKLKEAGRGLRDESKMTVLIHPADDHPIARTDRAIVIG